MENANINLELYSTEDYRFENLIICLTNKPELLTGSSVFFWNNWGLKYYEFKNLRNSGTNKYFMENIKPEHYACFVLATVDGQIMSSELMELEVVAGENSFRRKISLIEGRTYKHE